MLFKINRKGQKYAKYLSKVRSIAATYTGKRKVSLNKENTTITIGFIEALGQKRQTKGATVGNKQKKRSHLCQMRPQIIYYT